MGAEVREKNTELPGPGIYDFEDEYYHSLPYISRTGLVNFSRSPYHYQYWKNNPKEPTPAMIIGTAFHSSVLEPKKFKMKFVAGPVGIDRRSKIGKEAWAEFQTAHAGKTILDAEDFGTIERMTEEVFSHSLASSLLSGGESERSLVWDSPKHGLRLKGRVDYLKPNNVYLRSRLQL